MKFIAEIQSGSMCLSPDQLMARNLFLKSLKDDTIIEETIVRQSKLKTNKQLGAWWGLFARTVLSEFGDNGWDTSFLLRLDKPTGIEVKPELLKEYMYSVCSTKGVTMSKMDTKQMAEFFDACRNYAASQWSICVPEPDPDWREKE